jgi:signal transduction histidine kinase
VADARREWLRVSIVLAVIVVSLVEVRSQIQAVHSHRRLQARALGEVRARIDADLEHLGLLLANGTVESWNEALDLVLQKALASQGEILEVESGRSLFSRPTLMPVAPQPGQNQAALHARAPTTSLVQTGPEIRAVTWIPFLWTGKPCVLRLATPVPDIEEDLRQRQQMFIAHLLAISLLLLAAGLALVPPRAPSQAAPRALDAYEQAMGQLRDQGEARSRAHEAERQRMEHEIEDKHAMARAGELTSGIVHEVRNGLGTILGYARLVEQQAAEGSDSKTAGRHIREECETLEAVVRRFVDFVKRETLQLDSFDLVRTLRRVVSRESRARAGGDLVLDGLPDALTLRGDEELLERAFENLVRNAREAAGLRGAVALGAWTEGERVIVTVADDGPGIPPERRLALRPFFTTRPGGLGLGLPIAQKIVQLHEGRLELLDRQPHGLEVRLTLPLAGPPDLSRALQ